MKTQAFRQLSLFMICGALCFGTLAPAAYAKGKKRAPRAKTVAGSGCISAGVEGGCLMLTDSKTRKVYNLFFRGSKKPKVGTAIRFSGTKNTGMTMCMQGEAVNVRTWVLLKRKCLQTETQ
jgi:hypothetical protein